MYAIYHYHNRSIVRYSTVFVEEAPKLAKLHSMASVRIEGNCTGFLKSLTIMAAVNFHNRLLLSTPADHLAAPKRRKVCRPALDGTNFSLYGSNTSAN